MVLALSAAVAVAGPASAEEQPLVQAPEDFIPDNSGWFTEREEAPEIEPGWEAVSGMTSASLAQDGWTVAGTAALPASRGAILLTFWGKAQGDGVATVRCAQYFSGSAVAILDNRTGGETCAQPAR